MAHTAKTRCDTKHCRIHWVWSFKLKNHIKFPESYLVLSSRSGWQEIIVYCGPGAYYPSHNDWLSQLSGQTYKPPI